MNNPYQSYITSVLSNELISIAKGQKDTRNGIPNHEKYFYYSVSGVDLEGNPPSDEDIEAIYIETATRELIKNGADLIYKNTQEYGCRFLFIEVLASYQYSDAFKEEILNQVDINRLNKLSVEKNNELFNDMFSFFEHKEYMKKLLDNGLEYKQSIYFNAEDSNELNNISNGNTTLFELLSYNPYLLNLSHVYTYKDKYADEPEENAVKITLEEKLNNTLSYLKIMSEEEIQKQYKVVNVDDFKNKVMRINEIFEPILQYKSMEEKMNNKKEIKIKKKI